MGQSRPKAASPSRRPRAWAKPALFLGATALAVLFAEGLLSGPLRPELHDLRDDSWQQDTQAMHEALHQADAELVYVPRPDAQVAMDYGLASFDAHGLRETQAIGAASDRTRVVVLGDSLVWGELLPQHEALPASLQASLGPGHQVLNMGVSGYNSAQEAGWYARAGRALQADVVVLVYCLNDMLIQSGPYERYADEAGQQALVEERAWLDRMAPLRNETVNKLWWQERGGDGPQVLAALRHVGRWHRLHTLPGGYVDDYLLAARDPTRVAATSQAFEQLGQAVVADGAQPVLVISPALYWWHRYQWQEVHDIVAQAGEQAGFRIISPLEHWSDQDPTPWRFPGDNLHYTAAGNQALAQVIAAELAALPAAAKRPTDGAGSVPPASSGRSPENR